MCKPSVSDLRLCKDLLLTSLKLSGDYNQAKGIIKKVLLVEGATDKSFIEEIKQPDTSCVSVSDFMKVRSAFSTSRTPGFQFKSKDVITTIIQHIAAYPEYMDFPKDAQQWPLYGMVDNDFETDQQYSRTHKLFMTGTHDIETYMLSTDSKILTRLKECTVTEEEVIRSIFLAYQMSVFRKFVHKNETLSVNDLSESDGTVNYAAFTNEDKINLHLLLDSANGSRSSPVSKEKLRKAKTKIAADMKKHLDKDGNWKKNIDSFIAGQYESVWSEVNGHDVLSAVCYLNPSAQNAYNNKARYRMNRDFEIALTTVYDYKCMKPTKLYVGLIDASLINAQ